MTDYQFIFLSLICIAICRFIYLLFRDQRAGNEDFIKWTKATNEHIEKIKTHYTVLEMQKRVDELEARNKSLNEQIRILEFKLNPHKTSR